MADGTSGKKRESPSSPNRNCGNKRSRHERILWACPTQNVLNFSMQQSYSADETLPTSVNTTEPNERNTEFSFNASTVANKESNCKKGSEDSASLNVLWTSPPQNLLKFACQRLHPTDETLSLSDNAGGNTMEPNEPDRELRRFVDEIFTSDCSAEFLDTSTEEFLGNSDEDAFNPQIQAGKKLDQKNSKQKEPEQTFSSVLNDTPDYVSKNSSANGNEEELYANLDWLNAFFDKQAEEMQSEITNQKEYDSKVGHDQEKLCQAPTVKNEEVDPVQLQDQQDNQYDEMQVEAFLNEIVGPANVDSTENVQHLDPNEHNLLELNNPQLLAFSPLQELNVVQATENAEHPNESDTVMLKDPRLIVEGIIRPANVDTTENVQHLDSNECGIFVPDHPQLIKVSPALELNIEKVKTSANVEQPNVVDHFILDTELINLIPSQELNVNKIKQHCLNVTGTTHSDPMEERLMQTSHSQELDEENINWPCIQEQQLSSTQEQLLLEEDILNSTDSQEQQPHEENSIEEEILNSASSQEQQISQDETSCEEDILTSFEEWLRCSCST